jgi:hypothetical protein
MSTETGANPSIVRSTLDYAQMYGVPFLAYRHRAEWSGEGEVESTSADDTHCDGALITASILIARYRNLR